MALAAVDAGGYVNSCGLITLNKYQTGGTWYARLEAYCADAAFKTQYTNLQLGNYITNSGGNLLVRPRPYNQS
jgi:hypothetical protein